MQLLKLGQIFKITSGGTPSRENPDFYNNGTIPWIKTGDLKQQYIGEGSEFITQLALEKSSAKVFPIGTVLIAMYGATIGATSILHINAATNQACAAFLPNDEVLPEYLYYFFKFNNEMIINLGVGGAQPNISATILKEIKFPLESLDKQILIINVLDKAQELIVKRKAQIEALDELVKSKFIEMFGDPALKQKGWTISCYEDICSLITDGEHATPKRCEKGIYLLSARNVLMHSLQLDDVDYIDEDEYTRISKRIIPEENDILISCSGSVGRVCKVPQNLKFQMVRSVAILRLKDNINATFMEWFIDSKFTQQQILKSINQSSQANLFQGKIKQLRAIVPPIELQNQFADFVKQVDKLKFSTENIYIM